MKPKRQDLLIGRRLLKRLLPQALEQAKGDTRDFKIASEVARAQHSHLTLEKFDALVIHEGEMGGWLVDLVLRDMPPGIPDVLGTPVQEPHRTRQEAQDGAMDLLIYMIKMAQANKPPAAPPVFEFHRYNIAIHPEAIDMLFAHGFAEAPFNYNTALERLREIDLQLFPSGFSPEQFEALSDENHARLLAVFHMAAAKGVFRFPEPVSMPPKVTS